ncbi:MAG: DEAD/DEAH box helicase [Planctomycetes bacterium]|nr:DEAD/DEAH box helicase [Planctomycetota bacterium]
MKFDEIELKDEIRQALSEMEYTELTPVQEATFPHVLEGSDLLALAETGSGKTSACAIPLLQKIDESHNAIQALVVVPTRELALQYVEEIDKIATHSKTRPFAIFGGFDMEIQKAKLNDSVHILVATPGRLIDFIYSGAVSLNQVRTLVLDEADEMLNMGFYEDIEFIMSCMVHEHQTLMFSATMAKDIEDLANKCLHHPVKIKLNKDRKAPQSLEHQFQYLPHHARLEALKTILDDPEVKQAIIFINSRHFGETLQKQLKDHYKSLDYIHGGLEQNLRSSIFNKFKSARIKFLIATDVAGRGLDFSRVTHVINYDYPGSKEGYTHRTGRAGRMGRKGVARTFVTPRDLAYLSKLIQTHSIEPVWIGTKPNLDKKELHDQFHRGKNKKGGYYKSRSQNKNFNSAKGKSRR